MAKLVQRVRLQSLYVAEKSLFDSSLGEFIFLSIPRGKYPDLDMLMVVGLCQDTTRVARGGITSPL